MGEIAQLEELLKHMLQPNTDVVRQATQALNKIMKQSTSIPLLLELTFKNPHAEIRQIAAVLARKKIIGHWGKLSKEVHENTKKALLHALLNDPSPSVRRNVASLISILARALIPTNQWSELLDFLFQCTQSTNPDHREIALQLFNSLTETIGDHLRPHFQLLTKIFLKGLQDNEGHVRITALKAVGTLVQWVESESELAIFRELLPVICETIGFCITNNHSEEAIHAFEIFDDLIEMPHVVLGAIIPDIARFVLAVAANQHVDIDVRQRALTVVQWIVTFKPKVVKKNKMIPAILQVLFPMCADPSDEESETEELTNHKFASQMVDVLTNNIASKHTFGPIAEYVTQYSQSGKPEDRRAAVIILGVMSEGCHEPMREDNVLKGLLNIVYSALKDSEQSVREAGCIALGQFSKYLQPEIIEHYQTILPFLFNSLNDPTNQVRLGSCYAIEAFCENLGEEILPYLQPLMEKLIQLLQTGDKEIQELAISAITSTAAAAKQAFIPYFNVMLPFLVQLMKITSLDDMLLRCRATECLGIIASSVGRETFHPVLKEVMELVLQGMPLDSNELREFSYGFFANVAEIEKANFVEYLPIIVPMLLASCESTDGITGVSDEDPHHTGQIEGIESDEEDEEYSSYHVRTAFLDEKASAVHAIGMIAEHVGGQFAPFLGPILRQFETMVHHFDDDVRQGTVISYKQLAIAVNEAYPSAPWSKGVAEKDAPLSQNMRQFVDTLVPIYTSVIQTDDDKQTVGSAVECIAELGKLFGPPALEKHMPSIVTHYITVLEKKSTCQAAHDEEEYDEEEDVEDIELILIEAVCDSIVELVKAFGPLADPYFSALVQSVAKYQSKNDTASYRSLAIGTLAEMSVAFGFSVANYVNILAPAALKGMKDSDAETRSNSAYLWGILAQNSSVGAYSFYPEALQLLAAMFTDTSGVLNLLDNAAAAVARMTIAGATLIPLPQVLPALLKSVPLRKDFQENEAVYKCVFELVKTANPAVAPNIGGVLSAFAKSLGHKDVQQEIQVEIVTITKGLVQQYGAQIEQVIKGLPNDEQQNLSKYLS